MLDDIKDTLDPSIKGEQLEAAMPMLKMIYGKNPTLDDCVNRVLQPHEYNEKCLKSVNLKPAVQPKKPHHYFTS